MIPSTLTAPRTVPLAMAPGFHRTAPRRSPLLRTTWSRWAAAALLGCLGVLSAAQTAQAGQAARVVGQVRDAQTQALLYTEVHEQTLGADGAVLSGVTTYLDQQGKTFARKTLDFRQHRCIPLFTLDVPGQRYSEGIRRLGPKAELFKRDGGEERRELLAVRDGLVAADEGFNQLLSDQLTALSKGETVNFTLLVAGSLDQFRFRARALSGKLAEGAATEGNAKLSPLVVRVEPDSMLRMVVPSIVLSYDARSRALLRYEGLSNIPNPATGKVFDRVRIDYGQNAPDGAKSTSIE
jgi:hypothetical protein